MLSVLKFDLARAETVKSVELKVLKEESSCIEVLRVSIFNASTIVIIRAFGSDARGPLI